MLNSFKRRKYLLFSITLVALLITFIAYTPFHSFADEDIFETIHKEISSDKKIDPAFAAEYLKEMSTLHKHENLAIDPSIEHVVVLSGRGSIFKKPVDGPNVKDPADDYHRIELSLTVAKGVVANRSHKDASKITLEDIDKYGPRIIYNGRPLHNQYLKEAFEKGILTSYPESKFDILGLDEDWSTRGQFKSLKTYLLLSNTSVAIVTHAYHFPRVARMIDSKWHPFGPNTKIFFYLVDRELEAPGIKEDIIGEMERIPTYISKGDLNPAIPSHIHY